MKEETKLANHPDLATIAAAAAAAAVLLKKSSHRLEGQFMCEARGPRKGSS